MENIEYLLVKMAHLNPHAPIFETRCKTKLSKHPRAFIFLSTSVSSKEKKSNDSFQTFFISKIMIVLTNVENFF